MTEPEEVRTARAKAMALDYLARNAAPPLTPLPDHPNREIEAWKLACEAASAPPTTDKSCESHGCKGDPCVYCGNPAPTTDKDAG